MKEEKHADKSKKKKSNQKASQKKIDLDIEEVNLDEMLEKKKNKGEKSQVEGKDKKKAKKGKKEETTGKKKKKIKTRTKVILVILFILLLVGGVFGYNVWKNGGGLKGTVVTVVGGKDEQKLKDLPPLRFLLLGKSDFMTDTIMVCSYDPKTQQASMLSVPRDTFIGTNTSRARASDKINSRYQLGVDKTLAAINRVTGMELTYYVVVDTDALVKLVDAMGGVEFNVPIDMDYDDDSQDLHIHLKAGLQKLNGDQAEQVLRFRHNNDGSSYSIEYGDQDIGRMRTQREFIQAAFQQFFTISNVLNINKFIDIAATSIETNLDFNTLKDYVPYAVDFNTENLVTDVLPGTPELCNKVWVYLVDKEEATEVITRLFGEDAIQTPIQNGLSSTTSTTNKNTNTTKSTNTTSSGSSTKKTNTTSSRNNTTTNTNTNTTTNTNTNRTTNTTTKTNE